MRIVSGRFRGKKLATPRSDAIRPTTDRTRESLFNILAHKIDLPDARIIDCFAGTGALGLEAMSRGAGFCLFVDDGVEARGLLRQNIEAMQLQGQTKIFRRDATRLGEIGTMKPFDLAFVDPPYGKGLGERAISALKDGGWLNASALVALEERSGDLPDQIAGFDCSDRRRFGDTEIGFFVFAARVPG